MRASTRPNIVHCSIGTGFDVVSHVVEDPDCGGHTIWLAQLI